jgi:hypothetical protein
MGRHNKAFARRFSWGGWFTIFVFWFYQVILLLGISYLGLIDLAWRLWKGPVMDYISDLVFFGGHRTSNFEALLIRMHRNEELSHRLLKAVIQWR